MHAMHAENLPLMYGSIEVLFSFCLVALPFAGNMQPIAIAIVTYGHEAKSRVEIEKQLPNKVEDLRTLLTDPKDEYRVDHLATWEHTKTQRSVFYFLSFIYIVFYIFCVFFIFIYFLFIDFI